MRFKLLSDSRAITKIVKTNQAQTAYHVVSLALAHAKTSGHQSCPNASPSCIDACVGGENVGLAGIWPSVMAGRVNRTIRLFDDRPGFLKDLKDDIAKAWRHAQEDGVKLAVRLNTFSDFRWEEPNFGSVPYDFPHVSFYDYSKVYSRAGRTPANYSLCFSWTERLQDQATCIDILKNGGNVSIVFATRGTGYTGPRAMEQPLPKRITLDGDRFEVIDGDVTDLRLPDTDGGPNRSGRGRVVGLRLKASNNAAHERAVNAGFCIVQD
jgi:hypothetical protein